MPGFDKSLEAARGNEGMIIMIHQAGKNLSWGVPTKKYTLGLNSNSGNGVHL